MFIIDTNHQLIAADPTDLQRWNVSDIYEASRAFRDGTIRLDRAAGSLTTGDGEHTACRVESLDSLLGSWYLCHIESDDSVVLPEEASSETALPTVEETEADEEIVSLLPLDETETAIDEHGETEERDTPETTEETGNLLDEEIESLLRLDEEEPAREEVESIDLLEEPDADEEAEAEALIPDLPPVGETDDEEAVFDLLPETEETEAQTPEPAESPEPAVPETPQPARWEAAAEAFRPDLAENAAQMELDRGEYAELVREFVRDSRTLEPAVTGADPAERKNALAVLKDAVALLHLAPLDTLLDALEEAEPADRHAILHTYRQLTGRLEEAVEAVPRPETPREESRPLPPREPEPPVSEAPEPAPAAPAAVEETPPPATDTVSETPPAEERTVAEPTIPAADDLLKEVTPIPIEFSLQIASQELNLPEDLVLEFINDFAKQGHEYLPVLIDAYRQKDLDHLQKTAHMLKGAASNLRIEAMVDNLYDLQFDNDIERAPQRIRLFAGQLMSLDNYLKQMNT